MFKCVTADKYCQNGQPLICLNIIYKKSKKQTQVNGGMNTELQMNLHIKMTYPCQTLKKVPEELHSTRHSVLPHKGHEKKPFFMYLIGNKIQGCTPTQFHNYEPHKTNSYTLINSKKKKEEKERQIKRE